jgi:Na+/H+ antiporter NhaD/arsenite permease-like protein
MGASANVVVASLAAEHGKQISFIGFMKVAFPVMILTIIMANIYIWIWHL